MATTVPDARKISVFLPSLSGGGAERSMVRVATMLSARGHDVDLVTASAEQAANNRPVPTLPYRTFGTRHTRSAIPELVRHLRTRRPDALLTAMDQANIAGLVAARLVGRHLPVVVSYHTDVGAAAQRSRHPFSYVRPTLARWTIRGADHVVAVSDGVRAGLARLAPESRAKMTTIYNPTVDEELFELASRPVGAAPDGVDPDSTVLAVGRLTPAKGFDVLVAAFARLVPAHPELRLLILGEGPLRGQLEREAQRLDIGDRVHLPGYVANPYAYMARCRVYASSSTWEGLPTVLVEAGALGCRIVATDCPSGPREILDGRLQAELVGVGDVAGLAGALHRAVQAPHQRSLGDWSEHTARRSADRYEAVLRAVTAARGR